MNLDAASLERLVPDELRAGDTTGEGALRIGLERYEFAARHARPGRLLDVACGVGYGTRLLTDRSDRISTAIGVDVCEEATEYARRRYGNERTRFVACDAVMFEDAVGFDTIVSIETLEHVPDPAGLVDHVVSLLRPGGVVVSSVPTTPSVDANPHHLHDFTERSFRRLFRRHGLVEVEAFSQEQPYELWAVVARSEERMQRMRRNLPAWYLSHPGSLLRRIVSTVRYGLKNRYLTIAWRARG